ncbi:sensor histidine kinase [Paenibacillus sp. FA6]|uniref:sensor histidine kinase n=1 Tax=Paenibacillus sp. FA6 TaxID=3413029 RepID=UPI003F658370
MRFLQKYWFWFTISLYVLLGIVVLLVVLDKPFVSIKLIENNHQWSVKEMYYPDWGERKEISVGDIIIAVDEVEINEIPLVVADQGIRAANTLTVIKQDGRTLQIEVTHNDLPKHFYLQFILPLFYFVLVFLLALYVYKRKEREQATVYLIAFLLTLSLEYVSSGAATRANPIGLVINGACMLGCLIFLIHFLKSYFKHLELEWLFIKQVNILYSLPLFIVVCDVVRMIYPSFHLVRSIIMLLFVLSVGAYILYIIIHSYVKYKTPQILSLLVILISPLIGFSFLYLLPKLLLGRHLLSADATILFLFILPFGFILMYFTNRLFDMAYYINRLRYYMVFALVMALLMTIGTYIIGGSALTDIQLVGIFCFALCIQLFGLYIKERLDYNQRRILFSSKGDAIHQLYSSINRIGKSTNRNDLFANIKDEMKIKLDVQQVDIFTLKDIHNQMIKKGEVQKKGLTYKVLLHQNAIESILMTLTIQQTTKKFRNGQLQWLELFVLYVDNFIENIQLVEKLILEIKQIKTFNENQIPWLDKVLWRMFEEEKQLLAQELHDTILQEQLLLIREMGVLTGETDDVNITMKLHRIREQLDEASQDLRDYCEHLSPPLLNTMGLYAALNKLIQKVKMRAYFRLDIEITHLEIKDAQVNLVIYRIFQELFNNALKHSNAKYVSMKLYM